MLTASMAVFSITSNLTMPKTLSKCVFKLAQLPDTPSLVSNMGLNVTVTLPFIMVEPLLLTKMTVISSVQETLLRIAEQETECLCSVLELHKPINHLLHSKVACQPTGSTWAAFSKFSQFYLCRFQN
jgi:hypothetical protein